MKKTLIILNIISLIAALIWLISERTWEPLVTSLGLIGSLITLIYSNSNAGRNIELYQKGGDKSKNYQSARDININSGNDER
ncbi:hypothetical protein [Aquimarina sp. 2304DJ70-9]|uniref:hypothetical protein n=1 Tax=Aquimarina penaris TaxID=3231044 RepID=UPI0034630F7F